LSFVIIYIHGAAIIITSGLYIARRERRRRFAAR
jgi:hypothetical protein